jgi:hypothetical protein
MTPTSQYSLWFHPFFRLAPSEQSSVARVHRAGRRYCGPFRRTSWSTWSSAFRHDCLTRAVSSATSAVTCRCRAKRGLFYGAAFAHTTTRGLVLAILGQVTVLSLIRVTGILRGPQYPIRSTSFWLHSALHAAAVQSRRITRMAFSATPADVAGPSAPRGPGGPGGPAGPGGPVGPGSPFSPAGPTAPGSPFSQPDAQMDNAIATAIPLTFITHPCIFRCPLSFLTKCPAQTAHRASAPGSA